MAGIARMSRANLLRRGYSSYDPSTTGPGSSSLAALALASCKRQARLLSPSCTDRTSTSTGQIDWARLAAPLFLSPSSMSRAAPHVDSAVQRIPGHFFLRLVAMVTTAMVAEAVSIANIVHLDVVIIARVRLPTSHPWRDELNRSYPITEHIRVLNRTLFVGVT